MKKILVAILGMSLLAPGALLFGATKKGGKAAEDEKQAAKKAQQKTTAEKQKIEKTKTKTAGEAKN